MTHVENQRGEYVASINQQHKLAAGYRPEEPWLLLHKSGRTDRFASFKEARFEAMKSWPGCSFHRS